MRDFRDAKAMAQTLRASLTAKTVTISHSESLELVSKMFGVADWNTLSAKIQAGREGPLVAAATHATEAGRHPAMPIAPTSASPDLLMSMTSVFLVASSP